ncbi:MAG: CHAT domain-containing protein [Nitrospira sp.]|nr:CHAT domain-containing protein [Nitrospira sp.]
MNSDPKYLTIFRQGNIHIVDMFEQNTLFPKREITIEDSFIQDICRDVQRITLLANRRYFDSSVKQGDTLVLEELKKVGSVIFSQLLPDEVKTNLRNSKSTALFLKLDEHLIHIPWELCFDGNDFLTTKFRTGRQILTAQTFQKKGQRPHINQDSKVKMLIIVDPSETLKYAQEEAESLCSILDKSTNIDVELIGGQQATKMNLISELNGKDIVHFIGHSFFDVRHPENSGWVLKNSILTPSEIIRMDLPPFMVFSNSCQATAAKNHLMGYVYDEQSFGVGGGFLLSGVQNFIGPFWIVHDEDSVSFSSDFYKAFMAGSSLGEALHIAKENIIREKGWDNLLWASYVLYGDPTLRIKSNRDKEKVEEKIIHNDDLEFKTVTTPQSDVSSLNYESLVYKTKSSIFKPIIISLALIILLGLGIYIFAPTIIHSFSDFISNRLETKWYPVSGSWGYKDGKYTLITEFWDGTAVSYFDQKEFSNFQLTMNIYKGEEAWPDAAFGVIISSNVKGDALILYFRDGEAGWVIERNGVRGEIIGKALSDVPAKSRLKLIGAKGSYQAYLNGIKLAEIENNLFTKGKIGVIIESRWRIPPGFKNIEVKKLEGL